MAWQVQKPLMKPVRLNQSENREYNKKINIWMKHGVSQKTTFNAVKKETTLILKIW